MSADALPEKTEFALALEAAGRATDAQLIGFFNSRTTVVACSACGQNNWSFVHPGREGVISHALSKVDQLGNIFVGGPTLPAFTMVCGNCGFLRQHAAVAIGKYVLQQERTSGGQS